MSKMSKSVALEFLGNRIDRDSRVIDVDVATLRAMAGETGHRLYDEAGALMNTAFHQEIMDTEKRHCAAVHQAGRERILRIWRNKIDEFEKTDPVAKAEIEARNFDFNIRYMIDGNLEALEKFKKDFASNPLHAFAWGTDAVQAAAEYDVAMRCKLYRDAGTPVPEIKEKLIRELQHLVRLPGSTSPMSNLCDQAKAVVMFKLAGLSRY